MGKTSLTLCFGNGGVRCGLIAEIRPQRCDGGNCRRMVLRMKFEILGGGRKNYFVGGGGGGGGGGGKNGRFGGTHYLFKADTSCLVVRLFAPLWPREQLLADGIDQNSLMSIALWLQQFSLPSQLDSTFVSRQTCMARTVAGHSQRGSSAASHSTSTSGTPAGTVDPSMLRTWCLTGCWVPRCLAR